MIQRRALLTGLVALVAAPAIVKVASLMPVNAALQPTWPQNPLLAWNEITREAVRMFQNSNEMLRLMDEQYAEAFSVTGAKIGSQLRIRLPNDYDLRYNKLRRSIDRVPVIPEPLALAAAAVAVAPAVLRTPVTRRFWGSL